MGSQVTSIGKFQTKKLTLFWLENWLISNITWKTCHRVLKLRIWILRGRGDVWRRLCTHVCRKNSTSAYAGLSRPSSVRRRRARTPIGASGILSIWKLLIHHLDTKMVTDQYQTILTGGLANCISLHIFFCLFAKFYSWYWVGPILYIAVQLAFTNHLQFKIEYHETPSILPLSSLPQ